jgi:hypothetical protein
MRWRTPVRLAAIAVAALLLWGETGAADLDALLFHSGGTPVAAAINHVESSQSSARHHADHCLVDFRLVARGGAATAEAAGPPAAAPEHAVTLPPVAAPDRFSPGLHERSRAPPPTLA